MVHSFSLINSYVPAPSHTHTQCPFSSIINGVEYDLIPPILSWDVRRGIYYFLNCKYFDKLWLLFSMDNEGKKKKIEKYHIRIKNFLLLEYNKFELYLSPNRSKIGQWLEMYWICVCVMWILCFGQVPNAVFLDSRYHREFLSLIATIFPLITLIVF